jgi:hypothetical protein
VSEETTKAIGEKIVSELEHFRIGFRPEGGPTIIYTQRQLLHEPFIGFATVQNERGQDELLLICRHSTPLHFRLRRAKQSQELSWRDLRTPIPTAAAGHSRPFRAKKELPRIRAEVYETPAVRE